MFEIRTLLIHRVVTCPPDDSSMIWAYANDVMKMDTTQNGDMNLTTRIAFNHTLDTIASRFRHDNGSHFYPPNFKPCPYTCPCPEQTNLRRDTGYVLYYLTVSNGIFMGIFPMTVMIVFNIFVSISQNENVR